MERVMPWDEDTSLLFLRGKDGWPRGPCPVGLREGPVGRAAVPVFPYAARYASL